MALPIPSLDDRDFDKLYEEAIRLIPRYCPKWTDHNASDPGIILTELFAMLFDSELYQLDQLQEKCYQHFAKLLNRETLKEAVEGLSEISHAVCEADFEQLLLKDYNAEITLIREQKKLNTLARVWCNPSIRKKSKDQFIHVVIIPDSEKSYAPSPSSKDCQSVFTWLKRRCPITTKLEVVGPEYIKFSLDITVVKNKDILISFNDIREKIEYALAYFLSPLKGGPDGKGWPFGKNVYRSELYKVIEEIEGVDYVKSLKINGNDKINEINLSPISLVDIGRNHGDGYVVDNLVLKIEDN